MLGSSDSSICVFFDLKIIAFIRVSLIGISMSIKNLK